MISNYGKNNPHHALYPSTRWSSSYDILFFGGGESSLFSIIPVRKSFSLWTISPHSREITPARCNLAAQWGKACFGVFFQFTIFDLQWRTANHKRLRPTIMIKDTLYTSFSDMISCLNIFKSTLVIYDKHRYSLLQRLSGPKGKSTHIIQKHCATYWRLNDQHLIFYLFTNRLTDFLGFLSHCSTKFCSLQIYNMKARINTNKQIP